MESIGSGGVYWAFLVAQYLGVCRAACHRGERFVDLVLAYRVSNDQQGAET